MHILPSSERAKRKIVSYTDPIGPKFEIANQTMYPIDRLLIGFSLAVPFNEANEKSLRVLTSIKGRKTGKRFTVLKHDDVQLYEVARIA